MRNRQVQPFHRVSAKAYEEPLDRVEDLEPGHLADARLADGQGCCRPAAMPDQRWRLPQWCHSPAWLRTAHDQHDNA